MSGRGQQRPQKSERITPKQCLRIRAAYDCKVPLLEIAKRFGVSTDYISRCGRRRCKHQEVNSDK